MSDPANTWRLPPMPIPDEAREHIRQFLNRWPLHVDFAAGDVTHRSDCVECGTMLVDDLRCPACDPCSCGGRRWVNDEGWSPHYYPAPERLPGNGLVPCGFCSDWDDFPSPPYAERDSGRSATP